MRKIVLVALLLCAATGLMAQQITVSGYVRDTSGVAVPYATVSLLRLDSTLVSGATSDEKGRWSIGNIQKGKYILKTSFIGYETDMRKLSLMDNFNKDHNVVLREEATSLGEIEVTAKRRLVEHHADKVVFNVAESPLVVGSNCTEVLEKSPGVMIDKDGNITVNGKSVQIYINGKPAYMTGEQLKGIDGSMIDRIELITNPSAKYDAAGQGGIVDIKLKRGDETGLSGTVTARYGGMYYGGDFNKYFNDDEVSLNLNYKGKNTFTSVMLSQGYSQEGVSMTSESTVKYGDPQREMKVKTHGVNDNSDWQNYTLRLSNDWMIDDKNTFGFIFQVPIYITRGKDNSPNVTTTTIDGELVGEQKSWEKNYSYTPQHTANLNYTHIFVDSLSQELTVNVDYNRYNSKDESCSDESYTSGGITDSLKVDINTHQIVDIYSAKVDFQTDFWKTGSIECGLKWSMTNTDNRMTKDSVMGEYKSQAPQDFRYSEQVGAAYIMATKRFGSHWSVMLGLRGELTYAKGNWLSADTVTGGKPYFDLFPSANVMYAPAEDWVLAATYQRRIDRPSYYQLAPFTSYLNATTVETGNPELKPSYSHNASFSVGYSQYASLEYDFSQARDEQTDNMYVRDDGVTVMRPENMGKFTMHHISLSLTEIPLVYIKKTDTKWLTLNLSAAAGYQINENGDYRSSMWSGRIYGSLTLYLPYDIQFAFGGMWMSPYVWGYYKVHGLYSFRAGIKKQFLNKTLTVGLDASDLFRTLKATYEYVGDNDGQSYTLTGTPTSQFVRLSASYNFGKEKEHRYRKVGDVDESSRVGGGSGFGGLGQ